jgi:2-polyprenyl-6-methoxyphenol hydroxylase-like FAD-dependent oxidoreductase
VSGDAEAIVLGAGPAGSAAAAALARAGRRVLLLERHATPPEPVCGEFLSVGAARGLTRFGLTPEGLGARPIRRALLGAGRWRAELPLPFPAWSLPRAVLDAAVQAAVAGAGAELRRGLAAVAAERRGSCWRVRLSDGTVLWAPELLLGTGKHALRGHASAAALRGRPRGRPWGRPWGRLGLKLHLHGGTVPEGAVALLRCPGGYAGLLPSGEAGNANLCAALDPAAPGVAEAARDPSRFLALVAGGSELAAHLLAGAVPAWARPAAVAGIAYGLLPPRGSHGGGGPWRLGDQAAVIPSWSGEGVAMALESGWQAGAALSAGASAEAWHAAWRCRVAGRVRLAEAGGWLLRCAPWALIGLAEAAPRLAGQGALALRLAPPEDVFSEMSAAGWRR